MTAAEFIKNIPNRVSKDAIANDNARFHFDMNGEGGGQYTLVIDNGDVRVDEGLHGDADCKVSGKAKTLAAIAEGKENPMMAFMMGKVKATNQGMLLKYAGKLGLM